MYLKEKHHELHPKHLKGISIKFRMWLVIILIIANIIFWWHVYRLSHPSAQKTVIPPGKIQIIKPAASPSESPAQYTYTPGVTTPGAGTGAATQGAPSPFTASPDVPASDAPLGAQAPGVSPAGVPSPAASAWPGEGQVPSAPASVAALPSTPLPSSALPKIPAPEFKNMPAPKNGERDFPAPDPIPKLENEFTPDGHRILISM